PDLRRAGGHDRDGVLGRPARGERAHGGAPPVLARGPRARMRTRKALHRLVVGPRPAPGRVFFSDVWSSVRTNQRYAELVPRLERVDPYLIRVWDRKIIRGVEHRVLNATRDLRHRLMLGAAARRYRGALMVDLAQVPFFDGSIVVDLDDPRLSAAEVEAL